MDSANSECTGNVGESGKRERDEGAQVSVLGEESVTINLWAHHLGVV